MKTKGRRQSKKVEDLRLLGKKADTRDTISTMSHVARATPRRAKALGGDKMMSGMDKVASTLARKTKAKKRKRYQ